MPHIAAGEISIYYEIHGTGSQTLTMIRGLGADVSAWFSQIPDLSRRFRLVVFDNRGAGRTDKPAAEYSIRQMAADTKDLLDALGIQRTALLGLSMGGMIAQEFALHYPDTLSSLILGCTSFGGPESVHPDEESVRAIVERSRVDEQVRKLQERALYCDETIRNRRDLIEACNEARRQFPAPSFALAHQLAALLSHNAARHLAQIRVPTLVVTGNEDRLIPPENSRRIAARIPGAVLKELPGGHLFSTEYSEAFNREIIRFVAMHP